MCSYNIDLSYIMPDNMRSKRFFQVQPKGPLKPRYIDYMKDDRGRLYGIMDKPRALNLGGHKFNNVIDFSVVNFVDAATDHGKLYDLVTPNSDISAYVLDGKFALSREKFASPRRIKIGGHELKNALYKTETADGTKEYQEITKHYRIKTLRVNPDGTVVPPKKNLAEKAAAFLAKKSKSIAKLLKKF